MVELLSNSSHLHVLLNHVPTIGFGLGLALFVVALARHNDSLKRTSLAIFFIVATAAIATYVTGNGAESVIKGRPDVSQVAIRAHEDAALLAFTLMEVTGFFSWLALWQWRRVPRLAAWNVPVVLLLAVVTFFLMARAATLGGEITHSEIRTNAEAIELGRKMFDRDARYYDLDPQKLLVRDAVEPILPEFKMQNADELFAAIGTARSRRGGCSRGWCRARPFGKRPLRRRLLQQRKRRRRVPRGLSDCSYPGRRGCGPRARRCTSSGSACCSPWS